MARPPKNLLHYVGVKPDPEQHPYAKRWKPRQRVIDADEVHAPPSTLSHQQDAMPLDADDTPEDGDSLALPEPPPPGPGDDLRLPNPDRWAPEQNALPPWFWVIAVLAAVAVGVFLVSSGSGPRTSLTPEPVFVAP